ncbi:hypothetical protein B0H14DRAFT_2609945 [Mycena olivaceomarginata]|nr:hypothetical protein B0H14DRAFT_2609945 [Mycena olivaceomarginata]
MSRNEAGASISESQVQDIRRDVNAGRKKGAPLFVRQVTAIGNIDGSTGHPQFMLPSTAVPLWGFMLPPPPSQPHVSGFSQQPTLNQPAYPPQMYGYSSAHSQYRTNRQLWGSRAYQSVLEDFITVKYKVLREVPGKDKGVLVRNLVEGNPNIKQIRLLYRYGSPVSKRWKPRSSVHLRASQSTGIALFYVKSRAQWTFHASLPTFHTFMRVASPWEGIERYLTQKEIDKEARTQDSQSRFTEPDNEPQTLSAPNSNYRSSSASFENTIRSMESGQITSKRTRTAILSYFHHSSSFQRRAIPTYQSPNRDQLRDALAEGGSSLSLLSGQDIALTISDRVEFFPISYRPLNELIAAVGGGKFQGFTCDLGKAAQGSIVMEKDNYLGIGTFKTAHPAYLTLVHLTSEGLSTKPNEAVAVKCIWWAIVHEQALGSPQLVPSQQSAAHI